MEGLGNVEKERVKNLLGECAFIFLGKEGLMGKMGDKKLNRGPFAEEDADRVRMLIEYMMGHLGYYGNHKKEQVAHEIFPLLYKGEI